MPEPMVVRVVEGSAVKVVAGGPRGIQGVPGTSGAGYTHTQSAPATVWTINHNLGFFPDVSLTDNGGSEFEGDVTHPTVNQTVVTLNSARAGKARLL